LRRLARCASFESVVILAADPEGARRLAGPIAPGLCVEFRRTDGPPMGERLDAIRAARAWAPACWRGGLGGFTVYDEVCAPASMLAVMEENAIDGAVLVGADWCVIDPTLIDEVVARFRQRPRGEGAHRLTF